jgi:hypothetical protein
MKPTDRRPMRASVALLGDRLRRFVHIDSGNARGLEQRLDRGADPDGESRGASAGAPASRLHGTGSDGSPCVWVARPTCRFRSSVGGHLRSLRRGRKRRYLFSHHSSESASQSMIEAWLRQIRGGDLGSQPV